MGMVFFLPISLRDLISLKEAVFWIKSVAVLRYNSKVILMRNWGSRKKRDSQSVLRTPILILVLAFFFNILMPIDNLAWAKKTDAMPSPIGNETSVSPGQVSLLGPSDIEIPPVYGMVKERFQQDRDSKGFVIHIQDLHTHYQAHKNIAGMIKYLYNKHNVNVVFSEAKETDAGFAYLRPWTEEEARKKVAEDGLEKGILTGWEALDLSTDMDLVLQGVEDKKLYLKDMDAFLKAETIREDALKFVDLLRSIVENLKLHMYTKTQKSFDERMRLYRDEAIELSEYSAYLTKLAKKNKIDYEVFANLNILRDTLDQESRIDFKKAEAERETVIDIMTKDLVEDDLKTLLDMSMKFKGSRISQHEFYQYLSSVSKKLHVDMRKYKQLDLYIKYIASYHNLDASKLFSEINDLENNLTDTLFKNKDRNKLVRMSKNLIILRSLVDFKLTPDEFDYYDRTKSEFDIANWLEFLKINSEHYKLTQLVPDDATIIEDNRATLETFYKVAHLRDEAFVKNVKHQFEERGLKTAILMTGGFHTPGVMRRLKEEGYSYIVLSPRIDEEMDYEKYHEILKESYFRLKETTVIGAWTRTELAGAGAELVAQIKSRGGVRVATSEQERVLFQPRSSTFNGGNQPTAIMFADGTALLSRRVLAPDMELDAFLKTIDALRSDIQSGGIQPAILAQIASFTPETGEPRRPPIKYKELRGKIHLVLGNSTEVYVVAAGMVEVFDNGSIGSMVLAPGDGAEIVTGQAPRYRADLKAAEAGSDLVRTKTPVKDALATMRASKEQVRDEDIEEVGGWLRDQGRNVVLELDVSSIVTSLDDLERPGVREAVRMYLANFVAENVARYRLRPDSRVYFDIVGADLALLNAITEMYVQLSLVATNLPLMQLYSMMEQEVDNVTRVSISHEASSMRLQNITVLVENPAFNVDDNNLTELRWAHAFMAGVRLGLAGLEERSLDQIESDLSDESTNFAKLREVLRQMSESNVVTAQDISNFYGFSEFEGQLINSKAKALAEYISKLLKVKRIQPINFDEMKELHDLIGELALSV